MELEVPGEPAGLGLAARRPPAGGVPQAAHRAAASRPTAGWSSTATSTRPPPSTGTTWWSTRVGRAYVGNFGFDLDRFIEERGDRPPWSEPPGPPTTSLIRIDPDGSAHVAADDLAFPNGTVITPDGRTLIVAETLAGRLTAFDIGRRRDARAGAGCGPRCPGARPTGSASTPRDGCGWPTPSPRSASWWPRAATIVGPGDHLPDLLRLHARRRRPPHPLRDDRADQHRVGGQRRPGRDGSSRPGSTVGGAGLP